MLCFGWDLGVLCPEIRYSMSLMISYLVKRDAPEHETKFSLHSWHLLHDSPLPLSHLLLAKSAGTQKNCVDTAVKLPVAGWKKFRSMPVQQAPPSTEGHPFLKIITDIYYMQIFAATAASEKTAPSTSNFESWMTQNSAPKAQT